VNGRKPFFSGLLAAAVILSATAIAQPRDNRLEAKLAQLTDARNAIAQKMIDMLEGAAFDNKPIDRLKAEHLIDEAEALVASIR